MLGVTLSGIQNRPAGLVPGGASGRLHEGAFGAQEPLLVGIENRHNRDFGKVDAFTQKVDADHAVEIAVAQFIQHPHTFERVELCCADKRP